MNQSSSRRVLLVCADSAERNALQQYFTKHHIRFSVVDSMKAAHTAMASRVPDLIVASCSDIPCRDFCQFAQEVEDRYQISILALMTDIQVQIVEEIAESENIFIVEYPLKLREIRESIFEAFESLDEQMA